MEKEEFLFRVFPLIVHVDVERNKSVYVLAHYNLVINAQQKFKIEDCCISKIFNLKKKMLTKDDFTSNEVIDKIQLKDTTV